MSSASLVSGGKVMESITQTLAAVIYALFRLFRGGFIMFWGGECGKADRQAKAFCG